MVGIEIGVLRSQCFDRRIDTKAQLESDIAAWERQRNASGARIKCMFTTDKARAKMGGAYPPPASLRQDQVKEPQSLCSGTRTLCPLSQQLRRSERVHGAVPEWSNPGPIHRDTAQAIFRRILGAHDAQHPKTCGLP